MPQLTVGKLLWLPMRPGDALESILMVTEIRARRQPYFLPPAAFAMAGIALALACTGSPYKPATNDAATIYMEACLPCHQGGTTGPSLAGRHLNASAVEERLDHGAKGMPAFPHIRGDARRHLVAFIVRLSGEDPGARP